MQIPILNGIYTDSNAEFRTSYPRNMIPVPKQQGVSNGYLRPAYGIEQVGQGPGVDRGGINWSGAHYRVMGTKLVCVDASGSITVLGDVGGTGQVRLDYSFDRLAIASSGRLYYWDRSKLVRVTDDDLGLVNDLVWVDGYFMATDGSALIVTELTDPLSVNPLKYGSSEADPDPIRCLLKVRNEVHALNRDTIEVFENVGGSLFPFQRVEGAQIQKGAIGSRAAAVFLDAIAFVGGGRNEAPGVWLGANGSAQKISTREIETIFQTYSETDLASCVVETMVDKGHQMLLIHLPGQTLVYDAAATAVMEDPVWFTLTSGIGLNTYRARNLVWCHGRWWVGDPTAPLVGRYVENNSAHYGEKTDWEFGTVVIYNEGRGAVVHELELVTLPGRVPMGADPVIWTSYSVDGETWSVERAAKAGKQGERQKRINWLQQGFMRNWRIQKFRGTSDAYLSVARLEARVEALNV